MPTLTDPRAEAFAHARARGANLEDAYDRAGFGGGQGHASRFAKRPKVAARIRELIEINGRHPITGQDIAFELQRMVQRFEDFDTPQRMRETRETLMELRKVQLDLDHQRAVELQRSRRPSLETARTSPKPPVSARVSPPADRAALPAPRRAALEFAASPLAMGAGPRTLPGLPRPSPLAGEGGPRRGSDEGSTTSLRISR